MSKGANKATLLGGVEGAISSLPEEAASANTRESKEIAGDKEATISTPTDKKQRRNFSLGRTLNLKFKINDNPSKSFFGGLKFTRKEKWSNNLNKNSRCISNLDLSTKSDFEWINHNAPECNIGADLDSPAPDMASSSVLKNNVKRKVTIKHSVFVQNSILRKNNSCLDLMAQNQDKNVSVLQDSQELWKELENYVSDDRIIEPSDCSTSRHRSSSVNKKNCYPPRNDTPGYERNVIKQSQSVRDFSETLNDGPEKDLENRKKSISYNKNIKKVTFSSNKRKKNMFSTSLKPGISVVNAISVPVYDSSKIENNSGLHCASSASGIDRLDGSASVEALGRETAPAGAPNKPFRLPAAHHTSSKISSLDAVNSRNDNFSPNKPDVSTSEIMSVIGRCSNISSEKMIMTKSNLIPMDGPHKLNIKIDGSKEGTEDTACELRYRNDVINRIDNLKIHVNDDNQMQSQFNVQNSSLGHLDSMRIADKSEVVIISDPNNMKNNHPVGILFSNDEAMSDDDKLNDLGNEPHQRRRNSVNDDLPSDKSECKPIYRPRYYSSNNILEYAKIQQPRTPSYYSRKSQSRVYAAKLKYEKICKINPTDYDITLHDKFQKKSTIINCDNVSTNFDPVLDTKTLCNDIDSVLSPNSETSLAFVSEGITNVSLSNRRPGQIYDNPPPLECPLISNSVSKFNIHNREISRDAAVGRDVPESDLHFVSDCNPPICDAPVNIKQLCQDSHSDSKETSMKLNRHGLCVQKVHRSFSEPICEKSDGYKQLHLSIKEFPSRNINKVNTVVKRNNYPKRFDYDSKELTSVQSVRRINSFPLGNSENIFDRNLCSQNNAPNSSGICLNGNHSFKNTDDFLCTSEKTQMSIIPFDILKQKIKYLPNHHLEKHFVQVLQDRPDITSRKFISSCQKSRTLPVGSMPFMSEKTVAYLEDTNRHLKDSPKKYGRKLGLTGSLSFRNREIFTGVSNTFSDTNIHRNENKTQRSVSEHELNSAFIISGIRSSEPSNANFCDNSFVVREKAKSIQNLCSESLNLNDEPQDTSSSSDDESEASLVEVPATRSRHRAASLKRRHAVTYDPKTKLVSKSVEKNLKKGGLSSYFQFFSKHGDSNLSINSVSNNYSETSLELCSENESNEITTMAKNISSNAITISSHQIHSGFTRFYVQSVTSPLNNSQSPVELNMVYSSPSCDDQTTPSNQSLIVSSGCNLNTTEAPSHTIKARLIKEDIVAPLSLQPNKEAINVNVYPYKSPYDLVGYVKNKSKLQLLMDTYQLPKVINYIIATCIIATESVKF